MEEKQSQKLTSRLEREFEHFSGRFDHHLEIYRENGKEMARLGTEVANMRSDIKEIAQSIKSSYVTKTEFKPIKTVVYGIIGLILTGFFSALISIVIMKNGQVDNAALFSQILDDKLSQYEDVIE